MKSALRLLEINVKWPEKEDQILCGPVLIGVDCASSASVEAYEKPYYPHAASYQAIVIPNTGHNLPLHPRLNGLLAKSINGSVHIRAIQPSL